jgi:hypothetical protein
VIKESKPVIATADISLLKKTITFYLNKNNTLENRSELEELVKLFHRLGRLEEQHGRSKAI